MCGKKNVWSKKKKKKKKKNLPTPIFQGKKSLPTDPMLKRKHNFFLGLSTSGKMSTQALSSKLRFRMMKPGWSLAI